METMQGWDLTEEQVQAVIGYVKTFSQRWKSEAVPLELELGKDPWAGRESQAIAAGERAYHTVGCASCHPSFAPASLERVALKDSQYGEKVLPVSFTVQRLKSGSTRDDIYRVIASGISGAAMPGWNESLPEEQLWALAYYVESLAKQRR